MSSVTAKNVSVSLYHTNKSSRASATSNQDHRIIHHGRYTEIKALNKISFNITEGDKVGLIGKNGSGKTTLIRLIAGHLTPSAGELYIQGSVTPQISLGAGIKGDLSARENARLKCLFYNIPNNEVEEKLNDIAEICGLGGFYDLPLGTYSAGMRAKFVMALLTILGGEIMAIDEWIGTVDRAGKVDQNFYQKKVLEIPKIIFLASHSEAIIKSTTNKCLWLEKGEVVEFGETEKVFNSYSRDA